ncbi:MAG TPA: phage major capsid protein [Candidatus Kapabacteria bacterium]|nr:phage major capsid protein [Candidatus Kapabacteria bacterium]
MITHNEQTETLTASREELKSLIDEAVTNRIKSLPDRSNLKALNASSSPKSAEREKIRKTFRFFSALSSNDYEELRRIHSSYEPEYIKTLSPQVEGSNSAGGYLVPPEFYNDVVFTLNQYGFARKYCPTVEMNSNVLNVSTLASTPTVTWVDENAAITASKATFGRLTLTAKKLAAIYPISNELLADANIDVYNTIVRIFATVFAQEEDTQVFNGSGSPFTGILTTSGVNTVYLGGGSTSGKTKFIDITLDDMISLVQSLSPAYQRDAAIFLEQQTLTELLKKKDDNDRYLWDLSSAILPGVAKAEGLSASNSLSFRGFPIVVMPNGLLTTVFDSSAHAETPFAIFGNLKTAGCWLGQNGGVDVRISHDATADGVNAFTNDLQMMRLTERIAFGVAQPSYLSVLSTSIS